MFILMLSVSEREREGERDREREREGGRKGVKGLRYYGLKKRLEQEIPRHPSSRVIGLFLSTWLPSHGGPGPEARAGHMT